MVWKALARAFTRKQTANSKDDHLAELREWIPQNRLVLDRAEICVYECDGLPLHKSHPTAVVLCASRDEVVRTVQWCHRHEIPFTPRGAGTGLSGGATPVGGGILIDCTLMKKVLRVDPENRFAVVEPGVVNIKITAAAASHGLHYAPDPSSQKACTVGGNIAENSGGPHCLKYGMTTDHILGIVVVLPGGEVVSLGGPGEDSGGYDLVGMFVGTEGTWGVVVEATVRLLPTPESVRTFLVIFDAMSLACRMVSRVVETGIQPAALEILDQSTIKAVEASVYAAGYPCAAAAVLLIELDGLEGGLDADEEKVKAIAAECHALEFRSARDAQERLNLWKGRKGAFGAMGRINTDLYVLDGVVPRTQLEPVLKTIDGIAQRHRVNVANVFHAGDGNLHPNLTYDGRDPDECRRVLAAGREILQACVDAGGSISGEHGIGVEKIEFVSMLYNEDDIRLMCDLRHSVDPTELSNPGKIFPDSRCCVEVGRNKFMRIPL